MSGNQPSGVGNYRTVLRPRSYSERCSLSVCRREGEEPLAASTSCSGIWENKQGSTVSTWGQESRRDGEHLSHPCCCGWVGCALPKQKLRAHQGMVLQPDALLSSRRFSFCHF